MLNVLKKLVGRDVRSVIVGKARWGAANEPRIHYRESRPMPLTAVLPLTTDCSGFVTLCYFLAGAPDPNGLGYNGAGYTGTLLQHGRHIPLAQVKPGDAVVYGPGTGWHTALVVEAGHDPLTVSHGQEGGPQYVRVSQDGRLPQTYLRFPTTAREAAKHVPHAAPVPPKVQPARPKPKPAPKPKPKPKPSPAPKPKPVAKKNPVAKRRYYTHKRSVKLAKGQVVGFVKGRGYYAKSKPAPKKG